MNTTPQYTSTIQPPTTQDILRKAFTTAMEEETRKIIDEEAIAAGKRVEERVRLMTGQITTRLATQTSFERFGPDPRITTRLATQTSFERFGPDPRITIHFPERT